MESRMQGNLHVRFGAGDEETSPGNGKALHPYSTEDPIALSLFLLEREAQVGQGFRT
jgi:hypothetical protein